ncbi:MAG: RsmE family RNA methyltransferase [Chthonomonadales bacterium]
MRRLFLPDLPEAHGPVLIGGGDHHHLCNVLRLGRGDTLVLLDGKGLAYHAEIVEVRRDATVAKLVRPIPAPPEPPAEIWVAQALGKGNKFEQVIQHGTEVGASRFIPLVTERTIVRHGPDLPANRLTRWRQIARSAAEQCGRARIPVLEDLVSLPELVMRTERAHCAILLDGGGPPLARTLSQLLPHGCVLPSGPILLIVGPEGGFTPAETAEALSRGVHCASLGPYTLRTETAALAAIARIVHYLEEHSAR